jgi:choline dehydrogenase-like flavoprotein
MGTDLEASVVRPDFRHHVLDRLHVAGASVSRGTRE